MEGLSRDPASGVSRAAGRARRGGALSRRLVLWRHGRTAWNAGGRFQGQLDPPLDDVGHAQARASAEVLASVGVSAIWSSDLLRASATADALSRVTGLPVTLDQRLREIHLGEWQGLSRTEVEERFPDEFAAWLAGEDVRRGNGETYLETGERACRAVREALASIPPNGVLVVVAHGGTVRSTLGLMLEIDPASWWRFAPLANCRWSVLSEESRGWRLAEHAAGSPPDEVVRGDDR